MAEAAKNTPGAKGPEGSDKPIAATPSESSDQASKGSLSQRAEELSARLEEHKNRLRLLKMSVPPRLQLPRRPHF